MGRRFTLDEYLDAFTKEETVSLPDAISVRISDAQVRRIGLVFLNLMGGVLQCLRKPPRRRARGPSSKVKTERDLCDDLIDNGSDRDVTDAEEIIH
jgi:hypothetical protein